MSDTNLNTDEFIDAITSIALKSVSEVYGVIDLAKEKTIREEIAKLLLQDKFSPGIYIEKKNDCFILNIFLVALLGVKLTEVVLEAQKRVDYELKKKFKNTKFLINIYIKEIRKV